MYLGFTITNDGTADLTISGSITNDADGAFGTFSRVLANCCLRVRRSLRPAAVGLATTSVRHERSGSTDCSLCVSRDMGVMVLEGIEVV